jgi:HAD superfamily hydrolase (TIGR01509 family)
MARTTWIFFDVGYTLLDETPAWREQFDRLAVTLAGLGRAVTPAEINAFYERCCADFAPRQWKAIVEHFAPRPEDVEPLMALGSGWRHDLELPFPGVKTVLAQLAKEFRLGVIANQSLGTRERMEKHGLLEHLKLVIGSAEAGVTKPDPRIFEMALQQADSPPDRAIMVGDRLDNDIRPANLLGMKTVHVRQGGSGVQRPRDSTEVATATVDNISAITCAFIQSIS